MWPNMQFSESSVTFTEEIVNRKIHFLCSALNGYGVTTIDFQQVNATRVVWVSVGKKC